MRLKWEGKEKDGSAREESNDALPEDVCESATPNVANISTEALAEKKNGSISLRFLTFVFFFNKKKSTSSCNKTSIRGFFF